MRFGGAAPVIYSSPTLTVNENSPYLYSFSANNANLTWSVTPTTTLPTWLTLSANNVVTTLKDAGGTNINFSDPQGVAVDSNGNVYVSNTNINTITKVTPAGVVTTFAGTAGVNGSTDATGTAASFNFPTGLAIDSSGNIYVADRNNHKIRKITPAGVVTTLAGSGTQGSTDATGTAASFSYPRGVTVDSSGNVYVADTLSRKIRKITPAGVVTTLAGSGSSGFTDGTGAAASFSSPSVVAVDSSGNVYVGDTFFIKKVTPAGVVTTIVGVIAHPGLSFADGIGTAAKLLLPFALTVDSSGNVYVADSFNNKIRKVTPTKLTGTPTNADVGVHDVNLTLTHASDGSITHNFQITVVGSNATPVVTSTAITAVDEDSAYLYSLLGSDVDGDALTWSTNTALPSWLTLTPQAGFQTVGNAAFSASQASYTSIAIDSSNTPYVVYRDDDNNNKATVMKFNGTAWVNVGTAGFSAGRASYTSIAIDSNNIPYVVYGDTGNSSHATVMKFNGTAWVNVGNAGFSAGEIEYTTIAIDSNNTPYVVYRDNGNGSKTTVMKFNGTAWVNVGTAGFSADDVSYTSIAIDTNNTPYVVYGDAGNNDNATVMKFDAGAWVNVGTAGFSAGGVAYTSIAIDTNNTPYVVYSDSDNGGKATVMKFTQGAWENVGNAGFSTAGGGVQYTSIAIDTNNIPYVVYNQPFSTGNTASEMRKFDGTTWVNLGLSIDRSQYTSLAIASDNTPYIAYQESFNNSQAAVVKFDTPKLTGTPTNADVGVHDVNLTLSDGNGGTTTHNFQITVANTDDAPTLATITDVNASEDFSDLNITLVSQDTDGDTITYAASSSDTSIATVSIVGDQLYVVAAPNANGVITIEVNATANGVSTTQTFDINIASVNDAPQIANNIANIVEYKNFNNISISIGASDIDNDPLSYSLNYNTSLISASVVNDTLILSSIEGNSGTTDINITVSDVNASVTKGFTLRVLSFDDSAEDIGTISTSDIDGVSIVTIVSSENNLSIEMLNDHNGSSVSSSITLAGNETKTISNIADSLIELINNEVRILSGNAELISTVLGEAIHRLTVDDKVTEIIFEFAGANTVLDEDMNGEVILTSTIDNAGTSISIVAKEDGSVEQTFTINSKVTEIISKILGTKTLIKTDGTVETTAGQKDDGNGYYIKGLASTKANGEITLKLIKVNQSDPTAVVDFLHLVTDESPLPAGSRLDIRDRNGELYLKATIRLDKNYEIK